MRKMAPASTVTGSRRTWSGPSSSRETWGTIRPGEADHASKRDRYAGQQRTDQDDRDPRELDIDPQLLGIFIPQRQGIQRPHQGKRSHGAQGHQSGADP